MSKSDDISHIAKEVMLTGEVSKEQVSELAKMTAKQIYSQGYQAGEMASKTDTWNDAIDAAAKKADECGYEPIGEVIRDLKK